MNRFKVIDTKNPKRNGEGVQFSDGHTIVRMTEHLTLSYSPQVQASLIPNLEAQGYRLEWMDPQ